MTTQPRPRSTPDTAPDPMAAVDINEQGPAAKSGLSFRARISIALVAGAVVPIAGAGLVIWGTGAGGSGSPGSPLDRTVLFALVAAGFAGLALALLVTSTLTAPLRDFVSAIDSVSDGDRRRRIEVPGEDELAALADRYNSLASDLDRRDRELKRLRTEIAVIDPAAGREKLVRLAAESARVAFGMTAAEIVVGNPDDLPITERVPGEPLPVRAVMRIGYEEFGILAGTLPATRRWDPADQMLLELFITEVAFAMRNADLIERVERQNARLRDLDEAKDEFLRGISHNLQTPLTSIRASAQQLAAERADGRLELIDEQAGRLSRMVRQLVTVSRLDAGTVKSKPDVMALGPRTARAWAGLGVSGVAFDVVDDAPGWLAVADPDQVDQVLWALLDNAVRHGGAKSITVQVTPEPPITESADAEAPGPRIRLTIVDDGPGIDEADRARLFGRYERGGRAGGGGTGLGLYVSRELCRAMGGDLVLEAASASPSGAGAAFTIILPAEPPAHE